MLTKLSKIIVRDYHHIPPSIRMACWNLSIFTLGWGLGTDTFLSLFMDNLMDNLFLIGLLTAFLAAIKLILNLPIGDIDGRIDQRKMIIIGKWIYAVGSTLAFLAGYMSSPALLIISFVFFGVASPMVYTTYQCYIRERSSAKNSCQVFGLYNAGMGLTYCGGAMIAALIVPYFELHWFYVFPIFFSLYTILHDRKLKKNHKNPLWGEIKHALFKENVYKKVWHDLKTYDYHLHFILFIQFFWGLLDYVSFFFVPLLAIENNLSMSQIAILFGLTRMPYILSFFFAEIADKRERMSIIGGSLVVAAFLLAILGFAEGFAIIVLASVAVSVCLAIIRPTTDGVMTNLIMPKQRSEITGVGEFVSKSGQIAGGLLFGLFSQLFSVGVAFVGMAVMVFLVGLGTFAMKRHHGKIGILDMINVPLGIFHFHPKFSKAKARK